MDKKQIRKELLEKRDLLSRENWSKYSKQIEKTILQSNLYKNADSLLLYMDFHGEVGTVSLIEEALLCGKKVYLPKVHENYDDNRMDFYKITSTFELVDGYKGIKEPMPNISTCFEYNPKENALMLVPGVAFSSNGYRLGYGKGYYDKYLSNKSNIITVGLCFSLQLVDDLPANEFDIPMKYIVTENTDLSELNN